jgi:hypothetical protein
MHTDNKRSACFHLLDRLFESVVEILFLVTNRSAGGGAGQAGGEEANWVVW